MLKEITRGIMIAGAAALLFTAGACSGDENTGTGENTIVKCQGVNDCSGQGACAGEGHDCAGLNDCKGKGYLEITQAKCTEQGGTVLGS